MPQFPVLENEWRFRPITPTEGSTADPTVNVINPTGWCAQEGGAPLSLLRACVP